MKFTKYADDDSQMAWIAGPMTDSDWPVYFILRCQYCEYWSEEWARDSGKYCVEIIAAAPSAVSDDTRNRAAEFCGLDWATLDDKARAMLLVDYGSAATLWTQCGNNRGKLLKQARQQFQWIGGLGFGFAMDKPINRIGSTGWDFIKGEPTTGLDRAIAAGDTSPTVTILAKMSGKHTN